MPSEFEISLYRPEFKSGVIELMYHLWGDNSELNASYFEWKYLNNPYSETPLGIIAHYKDKVVGFRGYFSTMWSVPEKGSRFVVLSPGDTCVHPDHRLKCLSIAMNDMAMKEYTSKYRILFNTSASKNSLPGYLKAGFVPIFGKTNLKRQNLLARLLERYLLTKKRRAELSKRRIRFGKFNDIIVSESPRPEEMSAMIARQNYRSEKITLFQDKEFFRWRFNNKRNQYIFYYCKRDSEITGYMVIGVLQNYEYGQILDYAESVSGSLERLLRYVIKERHVAVLLIGNVSLNDDFHRLLKSLGFKEDKHHDDKKGKKVTLPYLIRPVKTELAESDWLIEGLDIRRIENWQIKGICNDGL